VKKEIKIRQKTGYSVSMDRAQLASQANLHVTTVKLTKLCKFTSLERCALFADMSGKSTHFLLLENASVTKTVLNEMLISVVIT
jgi:hypothetical protein